MKSVAGPGIMPLDRDVWLRQLNLCNFINSYCQLRDLEKYPTAKKVLLIGPGQGLDPVVLRWRGFNVTTYDIDDTFSPDILGSVHDMHMFRDNEFDAVIASHVLEHLPLSYLDTSLAEISRVACHAIIYLPVNGLSFQFRAATSHRGWGWSRIVDICKWWRKPDEKVARFMGGQHYWEIGVNGCKQSEIVARMKSRFDVDLVYRNHDWRPSMNFLLTSSKISTGRVTRFKV